MVDGGTVLLGAMGAFFLLMVAISYVNKRGLTRMLPNQRREYQSVSEFSEGTDDE